MQADVIAVDDVSALLKKHFSVNIVPTEGIMPPQLLQMFLSKNIV